QFTVGENDGRMVAHAERVMRDLWTAAGARDIWSYPRSAHVIGTCRMGEDPRASVVDGYGRSHEIPNLWISDNSTFPSALAANPALTIMAVALRTAERLIAQLV
ncbi:MAG: GMC family oxidoreductase, partial [Candidatus Eremiobacteraeota bacterium]|nr:GMC family oxidoreductase [Candidatus Eremiobacteraeota bacterium]